MASVRPIMTSVPQQRTAILVPSLSHRTFSPASTTLASFLKYRPLRQPQFNRMGSTSSQPSSVPPAASRSLHSSTTSRQAGAALPNPDSLLQHGIRPGQGKDPKSPPIDMMANKSPLSILPFSTVLRSWAVTFLSSTPALLTPSLAIMGFLAHTNIAVLNPDRNPLLRSIIKATFYRHFCGGENATEVRATINGLKELGFSGVIMGYAREVVLTEAQIRNLTNFGLSGDDMEETIKNEVVPWAEGTMATLKLATEGDYVALKFTGAGRQAIYTLSQRLPPPAPLASAIDEICTLAASRGVRLLFDAEQQAVQHGIDDWTLDYMRKYNKATPDGKPVIYGTYQAYLKATPRILSEQLVAAQAEGFAIGVKLVRGAYLGTDPRELIHDTKADTDACYNGIAEGLLRRSWAVGPLAEHAPAGQDAANGGFPAVSMVLASHNAETVRRARAILAEGPTETEVAFAQLQGMADEVSCEILACKASSGAGGQAATTAVGGNEKAAGEKNNQEVAMKEAGAGPRAYKYLVWGSTGECMKYLLRRARENRDAVQRTRSGREAMGAEVLRRVKNVFGIAA